MRLFYYFYSSIPSGLPFVLPILILKKKSCLSDFLPIPKRCPLSGDDSKGITLNPNCFWTSLNFFYLRGPLISLFFLLQRILIVAVSVRVYLVPCPWDFYRGLSFSLKPQDQFKASHWAAPPPSPAHHEEEEKSIYIQLSAITM